jgi:hypothetical protein
MIDTSVVRVHQHGARIADNSREDVGRSRGGLTSKVDAVVDTNGMPIHLALTPGEALPQMRGLPNEIGPSPPLAPASRSQMSGGHSDPRAGERTRHWRLALSTSLPTSFGAFSARGRSIFGCVSVSRP